MKLEISNMKGQFTGKTKKRRPPLHLIGHEVYEMVKDIHVVLDKQKMTGKNIEDDMWKKQSVFFGATILGRHRCPSFNSCGGC
jgi:hypothetical protein